MADHGFPLGARTFNLVLSAVAGFVDTAGFVALFGLFTAHVTGNFVLAGAALAGSHTGGALVPLATAPVFMAAVAWATLLARRARRRGTSLLPGLLALEAVWLLAFLVTGVAAPHPGGPAWTLAAGACGVMAMGIQNALMRIAAPGMPASTVMTGNFTQLTMDLVELVHRDGDPAARERIARTGPAVASFVTGAAAGAFGVTHLGFWCMMLPAAAVAALALVPAATAGAGTRDGSRA